MIGRWRWSGAPARRNMPLGHGDAGRFLPWVLALMVYVGTLSALGLIVLDDALRAADASLASAVSVAVPADVSDARMQTITALLRQAPGVTAVRPLDAAETARLLEPWLGSSALPAELPVPRLIDLQVDPAGGADLAALQQQLASVAPEARLEDHRPWLLGVRRAALPIRAVLDGIIAVSLLLVATASVFAARTSLQVEHPLVELMLLLGAADSAIAGPLALRSLIIGLAGGAIGAGAALLTVVALGRIGQVVQLPAPAVSLGPGDWRLWAALAAGIVASGLIAMASARIITARRLAALP